jgi:DNA-binding transcriptional MerR regulator
MTGENLLPNHDDLVEQFGDHAPQFQDALDAGFPLNVIEDFCDWAGTEGMERVTVSDLDRLRNDETYARLAELVLTCTLDRLRRVF